MSCSTTAGGKPSRIASFKSLIGERSAQSLPSAEFLYHRVQFVYHLSPIIATFVVQLSSLHAP